MSTLAECTVPEKILLAAEHLEQQGQSPFSAEELIVASWQQFPQAFGLKGFAEQYPDSNKVLSSIMGEKGLARRGWLVKMGQKLYSLTREGRQVVRRLRNDGSDETEAVEVVKLGRDQEKYLLGLLDSTACLKVAEGRTQELTFADACRFWGITENLSGEVLDARLNKFRVGLSELDRLLGKAEAILSNGRVVSPEEVGGIDELHTMMEKRFSRHLSLLRTRAEKK